MSCRTTINNCYGKFRLSIHSYASGRNTEGGDRIQRHLAEKLAEQIGISYTMLNEILNAKRPVTETMALYFEAALGIEAEMLTNMQTRYNMQTARKDSKLTARLQQIRKLAAIL